MEKSKLPKAFKKKWVAALRSGKYKQGRNTLKRGNGKDAEYCCLGVACVVAGLNGIKLLRPYIADHFGKVPKLLRGNDGVPLLLARLNDTGCSFSQIADKIERDY